MGWFYDLGISALIDRIARLVEFTFVGMDTTLTSIPYDLSLFTRCQETRADLMVRLVDWDSDFRSLASGPLLCALYSVL